MKSQILLKQSGTLDQYPYARYVYECITQFFHANGGQVIPVVSGKYDPVEGDTPKLWVIDMPPATDFAGKLWHGVRLPRLLKKMDAELIIILGWNQVTLPKTKLTKWLVIPDMTGFTTTDKPAKKEQSLRVALTKQIGQAQIGLTYSPVAKDVIHELIAQQKNTNTITDTDLRVWKPYPQNKWGALSWEEKEAIKELYTDGNEYFLIDAASADQTMIVHYLKAFSHFKKWQKSAMKFVILIADAQMENKALQELVSTFHFREDVVWKPAADRSNRYELFAAAYAVIEPTGKAGHLGTILEAVQYGSLAVALPLPSTTEILADALFALPGTGFEEIGQTMITIYKSEILRAKHIKASEALVGSFRPMDWSYWLEGNITDH